MRFKLLVKGDESAARAGAEKHSIRLWGIKYYPDKDITYASAPEDSMRGVVTWFGEPPFKAPYPSGTLLFYNAIEDRDSFPKVDKP